MVDDFQFDKQFKNIGIDKDAIKNTRSVGSAIEVISVGEEEQRKPEIKNAPEEDSGSAASEVSNDSLEELRKLQQKSIQEMNVRIDTIKNELNKVLSGFHEKIEGLALEVKSSKKDLMVRLNQLEEKFSDAEVESFKPKPSESEKKTEPKKEGFEPGDKDVAVENVFNFSNVKDFKRV